MVFLCQSPFPLLEPSDYLRLLSQQLPPSDFHLEEWQQFHTALPLSPEAAIAAIVGVAQKLQAYPRLLHGANCLILPRYKVHCSTTSSDVRHVVVSDQEAHQCEIYSRRGHGFVTTTSRQEVQRLLLEDDKWDQKFGLSGDDHWLSCVAQVLQEILDDPQADQSFQSTARRRLGRLAKEGILPPSVFVHFVDSNIPKFETMVKFTISGGFCDAHRISINESPICFRVLRQWGNLDSGRVVYKRFCRELSVWYQLKHPNILPLIGATTEAYPGRYCFLVPWLSNGSLSSYLKTHPELDKYLAVTQIVEGLSYLHCLDPPFGHKDLKGDNILVGQDLICVITDFGISSLLDAKRSATCGGGTHYWRAPELGLDELPDQDCRPRDIYSLGSTIAEILTGKPPKDIWFSLLKGTPPTLPPPRTPEWGRQERILWDITKACVEATPGKRPVVSDIKSLLHANSLQYSGVPEVPLSQSPFALLEPSKYLQLLSHHLPPSNFHLEEWEQLRVVLHISHKAATAAIIEAARKLQAYPRLLHGANCLVLPRYKIHCSTTVPEVRHLVISNQETHQCEIYSLTNHGFATTSSRKEIQRLLLEDVKWDQIYGSSSGSDWLACVAQVLQEILDDPQTERSFQPIARRHLDQFGKEGILPPSVFIHFVDPTIPQFESRRELTLHGGFCDAHKITINDIPLCFRVLRQYDSDPEKVVYKQFCRELSLWHQLRHPNVLPLIGATTEALPGRYCFIVPWLSNGSLPTFLKTHPTYDKYLAITQIVEGLHYLHNLNPPVGHKDLKGDNVLVGQDLVCVITDFGISSLLVTQRSATRGAGTPFWQAPELASEEVLDQDCRPRDIYSLGSTIYEILTGQPPKAIWLSVVRGTPPKLPPPQTPQEQILWTITKLCVDATPRERPVISHIQHLLQASPLKEQADGDEVEPMIQDSEARLTHKVPGSSSLHARPLAKGGSLNCVAAVSGVPDVGAATVVVQEIVKACEELTIHKQSRLLSAKCVRILNTFNDRAKDLEGSQLQQVTDELEVILEGVMKRIKKYSSYNIIQTFLRKADIKEGLDRCNSELDGAMQLFQIKAAINSQADQQIIRAEANRNHTELRDLLLDISTMTPAESRQQIQALLSQGSNVAEDLTAAGQETMRRFRKRNSEDSTTSNASNTQPCPSTPVPPRILDSQAYLKYQRGLMNLHRETGTPPSIKVLNGEVKRTSELAVMGGTYSDVWMGTWLGEEKVALKALRNTRSNDPRAKKRFENEINTWSNLKHDNILAFYGIVTDLGQHIHMVSPWQDNGNVLEYARSHPDVNRLQLLSGASQGLSYLHSSKIIHGNMKCANILVSSKGQACICDFGMSKVIEEVTERSASLTLTEGGSARWLAPELIEGKAPSKEADVYSFAMAILELMTGKHPYADCKWDAQLIHSTVVLKQTPARTQGREGQGSENLISNELWSLMLRCWYKEASARPPITEVCSSLAEINLASAA